MPAALLSSPNARSASLMRGTTELDPALAGGMHPAAGSAPEVDSPEAMARVLALGMVADTELDAREVATLTSLDAFGRLGLSRTGFMAVARDFCAELRDRMGLAPWLSLSDLALIDAVLAGVRDPGKRLLVCRLFAAVITADGRVHELERRIYDHMLARWGYTRRDVAEAIRRDGLAG